QQQVNAGNEAGIQNLRLHALEHRKFMMQEAAQMVQLHPAPVAKPAAPKPGGKLPEPAQNEPQPPIQ
ncbi:MAG: hypothetical protein KGL39_20305, partial [Patescibacteria group bacterium]|nr:hypothetical protein [Patescibacteria group bacterium]